MKTERQIILEVLDCYKDNLEVIDSYKFNSVALDIINELRQYFNQSRGEELIDFAGYCHSKMLTSIKTLKYTDLYDEYLKLKP